MKEINGELVPVYTPVHKKEKNRNRAEKPMGLNTQVLIGFEIFTVVIIALLWVFQIVFLDAFYENIRRTEVRGAADEIVDNLRSDDLENVVYGIFSDRQVNIFISDENGRAVMSDGELPGINNLWGFNEANSVIQEYEQLNFVEAYESVLVNGGSEMLEFTVRRPQTLKDVVVINYGVTASFTDEAGETQHRLVLLEADISPVDATVDALVFQLIVLTGVMIILGIVLALFIAKRISKPIVAMNDSAKELAKGNYEIHFDENGGREVRELASTLNYASAELSKLEALRSELIANVSHDLRTPLTMIKGYSEVMRDLPGENSPENLQVVIDEAAHLSDLVNDMLDLSRLESGTMPLDIERFNLTQEIREILKRYDKLVGFSFDFDAGDEIYVESDKLKITQVMYNLINNAVNYVGDDKRVIIRQHINGGKVRIEVIDHGKGIPADKLRDIWERYYKVDKEHKRAQVGTGLGLSIVKNILDMLGGTYGVSSQVGKGSTFWFELTIRRGFG